MTEILSRIDEVTAGPTGRCCVVCTVSLDQGWPFDWCPSEECRQEFAAAVRRRVGAPTETPTVAVGQPATYPRPPDGYGWGPGNASGDDVDPVPAPVPPEVRLARWDEEARAEAAADRKEAAARVAVPWWQRVFGWLGPRTLRSRR